MAETLVDSVAVLLETRVSTLWEAVSANGVEGRVAYDGFDPDNAWEGERNAKVAIEWDGAEAWTTGATTYKDRHTGTLLVWLREPAGEGVGDMRRCIDRLSTLFRRWASGSNPQLVMGSPYLAGAPVRDGAWMTLAWRCPFTAYVAITP